MDPFFAAITRTHLVLIAISIALAAFALSPHETQHLYAAQLEIRAIDDFANEVAMKSHFESSSTSEVRKNAANAMRAVVESFGLYIVADNLDVSPVATQGVPEQSSALRDFREFMDDPMVVFWAPSDSQLRAALDSALGRDKTHPPRCIDSTDGRAAACEPLARGSPMVGISLKAKDERPSFGGGQRPWGEIQLRFIDNKKKPESPQTTKTYVFALDDQPGYYEVWFTPSQAKEILQRRPDLLRAGLDRPTRTAISWASTWADFKMCALYPDSGTLEGLERRCSERFGKAFIHLVNRVLQMFYQIPMEVMVMHHFDPPVPNGEAVFADWFPELINGDIPLEKTPKEALALVREKENASRQKVTIAGQAVDEGIVSFAGPFSLLLVSAYLLGDLITTRAGVAAFAKGKHPRIQAAWMGLQPSGYPWLLTCFAVLWLPTVASVLILTETNRVISATDWCGIVFTLGTAACGFQSLRVLRKLQGDIAKANAAADLRTRSERRAEICKKRAERLAARKPASAPESPLEEPAASIAAAAFWLRSRSRSRWIKHERRGRR